MIPELHEEEEDKQISFTSNSLNDEANEMKNEPNLNGIDGNASLQDILEKALEAISVQIVNSKPIMEKMNDFWLQKEKA